MGAGLARRITPELVVEVSERLRAGRGCADLVAAGQLSGYQLRRLRALILQKLAADHSQQNIHGLIALEHYRLEAIGELAIDAYHLSNSEPNRGDVGALTAPQDIEHSEINGNTRELKKQPGNHHLLQIALKASDARRKLLGLDAPERKHVLVSGGTGAILEGAFTELNNTPNNGSVSRETLEDSSMVPTVYTPGC